jgi:thiol-disulfide isomerase/thioredoxin
MKGLKYFTCSLGIILVSVFFACTPENEFVINGHFQRTDPTPVTLKLLQENSTELIDSVFTSEKSFTLRAKADHSSIYLLSFFNGQTIYLIIHPKDRIDLDIDNTTTEISYYVENSPDSKYVKELTDQQNKMLKQIDQLSIEWEKNRVDTIKRRKIDSIYFTLLKEYQHYSRSFIYEHPKSLANILALYQNFGRKGTPLFDKYDDLDIFNFVDSMLSPIFPETEAVLVLNRSLAETRDQIIQNTLIEKKVDIGYPLPEVDIITISGDSISIGESNSNPVLLLFWASWNPYSVEELKYLQQIHQDAKLNKRLKIVSISLDPSEEKLNQCIAENGITLPVVCDYQYWDSDLAARYVVKRIPSVILADSKGKVIARDLFAEELLNRINEIVK